MNVTIAVTLLQTILTLIPQIASSKTVAVIINALIQIVPIAVQEAQDLVAPIKGIIAALANNSATTTDQLAALDALDAQVDATYDAALATYMANHAPANPPSGTEQ